ncbi:DNA gyrase subunit A [Thermosipho melanesiensis]|uniref:DNA gyrase subunit A n=2 Tax=Thermosipho melanesiensis TaxID=46541 RepID=A6LM89_THEM4|nr:DNA gyrase subunit A [Thermosipho melanesiensis]ABR31040.1 DNA gyrase, A subunit [Thermosipho melanesiensis BI429]APT74134.1 DNA gyrase subunit A [Thermosipho melanesiensis]OOC36082.1 DNA gyrase subunit A [Thermosipho melanesiensis]OOC36899.1 DNA gyrase subunit A [Thermosipho melanesiensis]OOC37650.1 DNA gyrase subunit A [Thermosipho melanesiensis]
MEINRPIEEELKQSYLSYSMSVIIGRAIPDVRDGLKPVQRRILYSMYELGVTHNKPFKKSARIVGEVMGKYHPHGDAAIYDTLVRLAQDWSIRYTLVEGQGNFGSVDKDPPAAMRYTEARLSKISEELLEDIDKETINMMDNFDGSLKEPIVLPSKFPNLLANGSTGIAVGMTTNIPPHNISELVDGFLALIKNPQISIEELIEFIPGPDFPTGGEIIGRAGIREMYTTGKGSFTIRGKLHVEEDKKKKKIVITEIPYNVSKADLIKKIVEYAENSSLQIKDIRDESDKEGLRIVIEIPNNVNEDIIINNLYKHTQLQSSFHAQLLVIDKDKRPVLMNLKELMWAFVEHRFEVVRKRAQFFYKQYSKKAHILEGLIKASRSIDTIISVIRNSEDQNSAIKELMEMFDFTETQAKAIVDLRLGRLTKLEISKLIEDYNELVKKMKIEKELIGKDEKVYEKIIEELTYIKAQYGDSRKSEILDHEEREIKFNELELIPDKEVVISLTKKGYLKMMSLSTFRTQKRGGKGVTGSSLMNDDAIMEIIYTHLHGKTLFFTSKGKVYLLNNYQIEENSRTSKGKHISKYINIDKDEKILTMLSVDNFVGELFFVTKFGKVKRTSLKDFENINARGLRAINFDGNDSLVSVQKIENEKQTILIATKNGMSIRFPISEVRTMGRSAMGVTGIKLSKDDKVVSSALLSNDENYILTVTSLGYGKLTETSQYRIQKRAGLGIKNISDVSKTGYVVSVSYVLGNEDIMIFTKHGMSIKINISGLRALGRVTKGVKLLNLSEGDKIADIAIISGEEDV